jgi:hypothetical protein
MLLVSSPNPLTQLGCQAKVDDLNPRARGVHAHNVFWLEVQVDNVLPVDVLHALQELMHVACAGRLRVLKVVVRDALKQFPAGNARDIEGIRKTKVLMSNQSIDPVALEGWIGLGDTSPLLD